MINKNDEIAMKTLNQLKKLSALDFPLSAQKKV
jgi:hypothetical protein